MIATHELVYGAPQALRDYLLMSGAERVLFVAHPLEHSSKKSRCDLFIDGRREREVYRLSRFKLPLIGYLIDVGLTFIWTLRFSRGSDLFVGVDPLNGVVGLILRKFRLTKKMIYYTIDYTPIRFSNALLNWIYHRLDSLCVRYADETWNVSPKIAEARAEFDGMVGNRYARQHVVPIGVWYDKVKRLPFDQIKKSQLIFVGHLLEKQGVQLVLEALPQIINAIPNFHFLVVGGGEYETTLRSIARTRGVEGYVTFSGWIRDRHKLDMVMADSAVAVAPYDRRKDSFTQYADPTKLKDYLSAGLPIVLTDVPHNAYELEQRNCAVVVPYDAERLASAVVKLMKNDSLLDEYRKNALGFAASLDWHKVFSEAFAISGYT